MLIKQKDDMRPTIAVLKELLALNNLSVKQRERIEEELDHVRAGARGEKEAAYHIDFQLKDARNYAVIHDLRLEHNGRVAQIDHLLIGRMFDVFVIESKNVTTALRVNPNHEFEVKTRWGWKGMASPVEQNKRHIRVLSDLIDDEKLAPTRLGMRLRPTYRNWVLIPPECNLSKRRSDEATILKMDMFDRGLEQYINRSPMGEIFSIAKVCSSETVMAFARKLAGFHRPVSFDYAAKFGIPNTPGHTSTTENAAPVVVRAPSDFQSTRCQACQVPVEPKVFSYCRANEKRFGGRILCRTCQGEVPHVAGLKKTFPPTPAANCDRCRVPVDGKVTAFCRSHSHRFGKRVLCRTCQALSTMTAS